MAGLDTLLTNARTEGIGIPEGWSELRGAPFGLEGAAQLFFDPATTDVAGLDELVERVEHSVDRAPISTVEAGDVDVLAWYRSFRHRSWGIYIREAGIATVASAVARPGTDVDADDLRVGFLKLYLHEYAHFLFDVATASLEDITGAALREPYRERFLNSWDERAEALCNAFAYRTLEAPGRKRSLKQWLRAGPPGYREFHRYLNDTAFDDGIEAALADVLGVASPVSGARGLFDDVGHRAHPGLVPIFLVPEPGESITVRLITALPGLEATPSLDKALRKLPPEVQDAWHRELDALRTSLASSHDFKRLKGDRKRFSARVRGSYRVLIEQGEDGQWRATDIGHRREIYR